MLACTPENFRAEMARYRITRTDLAGLTGLHPNVISMFVSGSRNMTEDAAYNLGWAVNTATGFYVFNVDMRAGPVRLIRGRRPRRPLVKKARKRTTTRRDRSA
jgi:hypothetical protein